MRKFAVILMMLLGAALLHAGAMVGFEAFTALASSHPAEHHADHGAPLMPFCPAGSICPSIQSPSLALAKMVLLFVYTGFVLILSLLPRAASALQYVPARYAPPPNHPKILLSVFKRE